MAAPRRPETKELIRTLHSKRRRRRVTRLALTGSVAVAVLAAVIAGAVLAADRLGGTTQTTASVMAAVSTTVRSTTTSEAPPTTATTQQASTTTQSTPPTTSENAWLSGKVVAVDPGHQSRADYELEPIGPGSSTEKARVSSGTASPTTGTPESEVTLAVGLKLRDALEALGIEVVMTRTTQDVDVPNSERARIANEASADLAVRLHCDGATDESVHGLFTLYPASIKGWTDDIAAESKKAAQIVQDAVIAATGAKDRGTQERSDLTGFNWSDVPDILIEMGFMTNAAEDKLLESDRYQDKIVQGLVDGIVEYLKTKS